MDDLPDFKLDAYLEKQGQRGPLCDVLVWLPKQPDDNGRMEVRAFELSTDNNVCGAGFSLVNDEESGFHFEVSDIHIRSSTTQLGRRVGGSTLELAHVGRLSIRQNLRGEACSKLQSVVLVKFFRTQR